MKRPLCKAPRPDRKLNPTVYTVAQVSQELGISPRRVREIATTLNLGSKMGARLIVFTAKEVEAMKANRDEYYGSRSSRSFDGLRFYWWGWTSDADRATDLGNRLMASGKLVRVVSGPNSMAEPGWQIWARRNGPGRPAGKGA